MSSQGELVQAEHRGNDRVMAEGIDMGVAFVAGQERDQNAAEDPGLLGGALLLESVRGHSSTHRSQRPLVFRN